MRSIFYSLACGVLVGTSAALQTTTKVCPVLGQVYPVPSGLSSNEKFQAATKLFDAALNTTLETGISTDGAGPFNATTLSIGMFSASEKGLIYQRHYTDPSVRNSKFGTQNADADSIYRLGSISKLLTVYLFLIREGDSRFNDPVTKYIPELAAAASSPPSPNGITPNWNEITIGQLASHMSGIATDYGTSELSYPGVTPPGLPPIPENQAVNCNFVLPDGSFKPCTPEGEYYCIHERGYTDRMIEYLAGVVMEPALFHSGYTPSYSNNGFELLGLVLENITNSDLGKLFTESIVETHCLTHTSLEPPSTLQNAVIPENTTISGWNANLGVLNATGGYFSSTNDMATLGKAMLNGTILSKAQTRRWMKPVTFTANPNQGTGAPWEIFRTQVNGRVIDMYTKNGGFGDYATILVLVPDFDFGFSILTASTRGEAATSPLVYLISEMIASTVLPALDQVAKDQAEAAFAGHYAASSLNSSLTITADDQPGLRVTNWVSNGTEFFQDIGLGNNLGTYVDFRLQPNQLYTEDQVGFTGVGQTMPTPIYTGPFDVNCFTWGSVDRITYGNVGIEEFVFEIDPTTGKATNVQPKALRIKLEKQA
ncbi:hypothetical protein G7Y89_g6535 [Cudoniella acicularis]|uniref:Beta-lactamase-related domain-containing protein n=1 Tax=Cudoniella acicularis TaxID=354080 RepID=A0A8H4RL39_9HELO|nr:hypothetical protein G7Y89_g6535 [Cudoniella acicularis]